MLPAKGIVHVDHSFCSCMCVFFKLFGAKWKCEDFKYFLWTKMGESWRFHPRLIEVTNGLIRLQKVSDEFWRQGGQIRMLFLTLWPGLRLCRLTHPPVRERQEHGLDVSQQAVTRSEKRSFSAGLTCHTQRDSTRSVWLPIWQPHSKQRAFYKSHTRHRS